MRIFGRHDAWLALGLIVAALVIFAQPVSQLLDFVREVESSYGLALLPGLLILSVALLLHVQNKRTSARAQALASASAAEQSEARRQELERLVVFGQALACSLDLSAIRDVLHQYLPQITGRHDVWVLFRSADHWEALMGGDIDAAHGHVRALGRTADHALSFESDARLRSEGIQWEGQLCFPMVAAGSSVGVMGFPKQEAALSEGQTRLIAAAATLLAVSVKNAELFRQVHENSLRDGLTGCFNRTHALEAIDTELRRARRSLLPVSLLMFDIDHFKNINDRFGHLCGDAVLSAVGRRMKAVLRGSDLRCRYGGEEFLVLLPETPIDGARRVAETLRRELAENPVQWGATTVPVTASFGVAAALPGEIEASALVARADAATYRAKEEGRNCVRVGAEEVMV